MTYINYNKKFKNYSGGSYTRYSKICKRKHNYDDDIFDDANESIDAIVRETLDRCESHINKSFVYSSIDDILLEEPTLYKPFNSVSKKKLEKNEIYETNDVTTSTDISMVPSEYHSDRKRPIQLFNVIAKNSFIQESFKKYNYDNLPPKSHSSVKNIIVRFAADKKQQLPKYFKEQIELGTSTKLIEILSKKLKEFNIYLNKHIVGYTIDGASVMVKSGKDIEPLHQIGIAHTIHLAISDTLCTSNNDNNLSDSDSESEDIDVEEFDDFEYIENITNFKLNENYKKIIDKVRTISKIFRKSSIKNEKLQDFVYSEFSKEMNLLIDIKIRWNSLLPMITRDRYEGFEKCSKLSSIDETFDNQTLENTTSYEDSDISFIMNSTPKAKTKSHNFDFYRLK
ncbi:hypothetical protein A3Q56_02537 [Intoshia linei]|uniref:DUF4371 domain-containing protein n=1 Tax=Intoshia linei TaxID=1819745 RepID=A0A177B7V5_9BILA|nr:hypothetical protein A3Q56_02537 [Intoshia linei]